MLEIWSCIQSEKLSRLRTATMASSPTPLEMRSPTPDPATVGNEGEGLAFDVDCQGREAPPDLCGASRQFAVTPEKHRRIAVEEGLRVEILDPVVVAGALVEQGSVAHGSLLQPREPSMGLACNPLVQPRHDTIRDLRACGLRLHQVVVTGNQRELLVPGAETLMDAVRVAREAARVGHALHHERRIPDLREMRPPAALGFPQAPHREPGPQRVAAADPERAVVRALGVACITDSHRAIGRVEGAVHQAQVGPGARQEVEEPVRHSSCAASRSSSSSAQSVMRWLRASCAAR